MKSPKTPEEIKSIEDKIAALQADQTVTEEQREKHIQAWQHQLRYGRPKDDYDKYCFHAPKPITPEWLAEQYAAGKLIPVSQLIGCEFYEGSCRNASVAVWDGILKKFMYVRHKFGSAFIEDINTVENDDGYDLFLPHYRIMDRTDERVAELKNLLSKRGNREP